MLATLNPKAQLLIAEALHGQVLDVTLSVGQGSLDRARLLLLVATLSFLGVVQLFASSWMVQRADDNAR